MELRRDKLGGLTKSVMCFAVSIRVGGIGSKFDVVGVSGKYVGADAWWEVDCEVACKKKGVSRTDCTPLTELIAGERIDESRIKGGRRGKISGVDKMPVPKEGIEKLRIYIGQVELRSSWGKDLGDGESKAVKEDVEYGEGGRDCWRGLKKRDQKMSVIMPVELGHKILEIENEGGPGVGV